MTHHYYPFRFTSAHQTKAATMGFFLEILLRINEDFLIVIR